MAFRDTWELGIHSYLTYLRDRLFLARELLSDSGSCFVQIDDENLHHVKEIMDEVFSADNLCAIISFTKTRYQSTKLLPSITDFILWYSKSKQYVKYHQLYLPKEHGQPGGTGYTLIESPDGKSWRNMTKEERNGIKSVPEGWRIFDGTPLVSAQASEKGSMPYEFEGKRYFPPANRHWTLTKEGLDGLVRQKRIFAIGNRLEYRKYIDDFPYTPLTNMWLGLGERGFAGEKKLYYSE